MQRAQRAAGNAPRAYVPAPRYGRYSDSTAGVVQARRVWHRYSGYGAGTAGMVRLWCRYGRYSAGTVPARRVHAMLTHHRQALSLTFPTLLPLRRSRLLAPWTV